MESIDSFPDTFNLINIDKTQISINTKMEDIYIDKQKGIYTFLQNYIMKLYGRKNILFLDFINEIRRIDLTRVKDYKDSIDEIEYNKLLKNRYYSINLATCLNILYKALLSEEYIPKINDNYNLNILSLKNLYVYRCIIFKCETLVIINPQNPLTHETYRDRQIQSMRLEYYTFDYKRNTFPYTLQKLEIQFYKIRDDETFMCEFLPTSLRELYIKNYYNTAVNLRHLTNLEKFELDSGIFNKVFDDNIFPNSLKRLDLYIICYEQKLNPKAFNKTLQELYIHINEYAYPFEKELFPDGLSRLYICRNYNLPFTFDILPQKLKYLHLDLGEEGKIIGALPKSIDHIEIIKYFEGEVVDYNVRKLSLGISYYDNGEIDTHNTDEIDIDTDTVIVVRNNTIHLEISHCEGIIDLRQAYNLKYIYIFRYIPTEEFILYDPSFYIINSSYAHKIFLDDGETDYVIDMMIKVNINYINRLYCYFLYLCKINSLILPVEIYMYIYSYYDYNWFKKTFVNCNRDFDNPSIWEITQ